MRRSEDECKFAGYLSLLQEIRFWSLLAEGGGIGKKYLSFSLCGEFVDDLLRITWLNALFLEPLNDLFRNISSSDVHILVFLNDIEVWSSRESFSITLLAVVIAQIHELMNFW